ncbi:MAG: hypothetical protein HKN12_09675, partial [Gemmatimonadetes bacterium]|nr:hypothetical protein [Gemmatimonadota bacterium]
MFPRWRVVARLSLFALLLPALAAAESWPVDKGNVAFAFAPGRLAELGLSVTGPARTVTTDSRDLTGLDGDVLGFSLTPAGDAAAVTLDFQDGRFASFGNERTIGLRATGGFALRARHPSSGAALAPAMLYDFRVELTAGSNRPVRITSSDPSLPEPFVIRGRGLGLDARRNAVAVSMADVLVSESWAAAMNRPEMAGQWLGSLDVSLKNDGLAKYFVPRPVNTARQAVGADIELGELYGLLSIGRDVPYPNGSAAFSAATTSCNPGTEEVEWQLGTADTLKENHPFIGLGIYRESADGTLEMISRNWIKHGFFATSNDDCGYGCASVPNGTALGIGCADTYTVGHNGSRLYLGPREEVNPHTADWTACGSFFDASPADCFRDYFGSEVSEVAHRLEVFDEDMEHPGARYFYEGVYYVKDDVDIANNIGWREFTATWAGLWVLVTLPADSAWADKDNDGALIET